MDRIKEPEDMVGHVVCGVRRLSYDQLAIILEDDKVLIVEADKDLVYDKRLSNDRQYDLGLITKNEWRDNYNNVCEKTQGDIVLYHGCSRTTQKTRD